MKNRLMDTFLSWIKLSLPAEVIENLLAENPAMIELIFEELSSEDDDNLQVAVNCIVELITISRIRRNNFGSFLDLVVSRVQTLQEHVSKVIASGDFERADQFTEIFVELGFSNMESIIDQGSPLLDILLALLEMEDSTCYA